MAIKELVDTPEYRRSVNEWLDAGVPWYCGNVDCYKPMKKPRKCKKCGSLHIKRMRDGADFRAIKAADVEKPVRKQVEKPIRTPLTRSESRKRSYERLKAEGKIYGHIPYGYNNEGGRLVPNEDEQAAIRLMGKLRASGCGIVKIASELTKAGIPTKSGASVWSKNSVKQILKNDIHAEVLRDV